VGRADRVWKAQQGATSQSEGGIALRCLGRSGQLHRGSDREPFRVAARTFQLGGEALQRYGPNKGGYIRPLNYLLSLTDAR